MPDGFQPIIYKSYWPVVSHEVCTLVQEAFNTNVIPPKLAKTLIVLIHKGDNPTSLKDFRLISLCNVLFKFISKVLVNRIRPHLDTIIGPL